MRALPPAHVPRPRLIQALASAPVGLVEAPGGFGKSVLAAELAAALDLPELEADLVGSVSTPSLLVAALRRGAARSGLSDLATELQRVVDDDPASAAASLADVLGSAGALLLVVDEAELLGGAAVDVLGALARHPPGRTRVLVLGRTLPPRVVALAGHAAVRLDAGQLTFDRREVAAVLEAALGEEAGALEEEAVFAAGQGWPALTALAAARLAREPAATRAQLGGSRRTLSSLVDDALAGLDGAARQVAAQLAHLPLLSPLLVDAVAGDGAFAQLVAHGLPLAPRGDGWHELPGRVREELAGRGALDGNVARRASAVYAASG